MTDKYEMPKWLGNLVITLIVGFCAALAGGLLLFLFRWLYHLTN